MTKIKIKYLFIIIVAIFCIYLFFVSKLIFEKHVNKYLTDAGIKQEDVIKKEIIRNSKQGGYIANIIFRKDSEYTYQFSLTGYNLFNYMDYKKINLDIYDKENVEYTLKSKNIKPKYFIKTNEDME